MDDDEKLYKKSLEDPEEPEKPLNSLISPPRIPIKRRRLRLTGYRSPPVAHQFKPGQSGNPKGRPRGSKNVRKAVEEIFTGKLTVREGNKVRRVTKIEAVLLTQLNQALRGNHRAVQAVVATIKDLGLLDVRPDKLVLGDLRFLTDAELVELERLLEKASARRVPQ
jgi:hypothetical protein